MPIDALTVINLVAKVGIPLAEIILKNLSTVTTIEDAIAALGAVRTTQEYIQADAQARGVAPRPLPASA